MMKQMNNDRSAVAMQNDYQKPWVVAILALITILLVRFDGKPEIYMGLIVAYIVVFFMGFFAKRWISSLGSLAGVGLGIVARLHYPPVKTFKDEAKALAYQEKAGQYADFLAGYWWLLLLAAVAVGYLGALIGQKAMQDRTEKFTTRQITYIGVMVALTVVINVVRVGVVNFTGFPIILSGYLLGPIPGFVVGGVADVIGFVIRPSGPYVPIFTLTSALTGLIPVIISRLLGDAYPKFSFWKVLVGVFVGQFATSVIIVPLFRSLLLSDQSFWYFAVKAAGKQIVSIPLYAFFVTALVDRLSKVIDFRSLGKRKLNLEKGN